MWLAIKFWLAKELAKIIYVLIIIVIAIIALAGIIIYSNIKTKWDNRKNKKEI